MELYSNSSEETFKIGIDFAKKLKNLSGAKIGFIGELGAGKTLFIKGFLSALMPNITVTSPTYTLINVYESKDRIIHHVDLYRINDPEELVMVGFYEILKDTKAMVLIEWYDRISKTVDIANDIITVTIEQVSENKRRILINE